MTIPWKGLDDKSKYMQNGCVREEIVSLVKVLENVSLVGDSTLTGEVAVARSRLGLMSTYQGAKGNSGQERNEKSVHPDARRRRKNGPGRRIECCRKGKGNKVGLATT